MRHVTIITTGGTIEKTYDEASGRLENRSSVVRGMVQGLRLEDCAVTIVELMGKDSLDMTEDDRERIVEAVRQQFSREGPDPVSGVVILHGTDTLAVTGERLFAAFPEPPVPVVLTGAMRPFELVRSDAVQNLTEAVFATGVVTPGVYCSAHGRILRFPGVVKDRARGTFVKP